MQEKNILLTIFAVCILLITLLICFIGVIVYLYQKKQHAHIRQIEQQKHHYATALLQSRLEIQEQTLHYLNREIHDNIGHELTLAKLNLTTIQREVGAASAQKIETVIDLLAKVTGDLRDATKSRTIDLIRTSGLVSAIENEIAQLKKPARYDVSFNTVGDYTYQEEQIEIFLFRIMQEAINNIIRHAQATTIKIILGSSDDIIHLRIWDDGKGFNADTYLHQGTTDRPERGIRHMQERALLLGGEIHIQSLPGSGTLVSITVPQTQHHDTDR